MDLLYALMTVTGVILLQTGVVTGAFCEELAVMAHGVQNFKYWGSYLLQSLCNINYDDEGSGKTSSHCVLRVIH